MKELASLPNVICKISGVTTEADHKNWTREQLKPYIAHAIEAFGFDRVMYGGDWHVSELAGTYPEWVDIVDWVIDGRDAGREAQALPRQRHPRLSPRPHERAGPALAAARLQHRGDARAGARARCRGRSSISPTAAPRTSRRSRRNEAAFDDVELLPRPLNGAATRDLSITLFGKRLSMPVIVGPTGLAGLFWPDGERCAARAAAAAGTAFCLSHGSVCTLEELAATGAAPRWMQVFIYNDRGFTRELAERAAKAGYRRAGAHHRQPDARQPRARHPQRLHHPAALRAGGASPAWRSRRAGSGACAAT